MFRRTALFSIILASPSSFLNVVYKVKLDGEVQATSQVCVQCPLVRTWGNPHFLFLALLNLFTYVLFSGFSYTLITLEQNRLTVRHSDPIYITY